MKNIKFWYILGALIFIAGLCASIWMIRKPEGNMVVILQDGEALYQLDLENYKEPTVMEIAYENGQNTVLIENGRICISHADCSDQTCVKRGYLDSSTLPIVCLPHHLVIQYANSTKMLDGVAE